MVAYTFDPRETEAGGWISAFEASLVCRVSSKITKATQRTPALKKSKEKRKNGHNENP